MLKNLNKSVLLLLSAFQLFSFQPLRAAVVKIQENPATTNLPAALDAYIAAVAAATPASIATNAWSSVTTSNLSATLTNWLKHTLKEFGGAITNDIAAISDVSADSAFAYYPLDIASTNFTVLGGKLHGPIANLSAQSGFYYPSNEQTGITGQGIGQASLTSINFETDSSYVVLRLSGGGGVLSAVIDGHDVIADSLTAADFPHARQMPSTETYVNLGPFNTGGRHTISLRQPGYVKGVYIYKTNGISRTTTPSKKLLLMGDSFIQAADGNSISVMKPVSRFVQEGLPDWDVLAYGQQGTGWLNTDTGGRTNFYGRYADILRERPDALIVYGGYNDVGLATNALQTNPIFSNATNLLMRSRAAFPTMPIVVIAVNWPRALTYPATGTDIQVTNLCFLLKTACASVTNVHYFSTIDEPWITGIYSTPGSGNAVQYTSDDGIHPTTAGHWYLGQKILAVAKPVLNGSVISTNAVVQMVNASNVLTRSMSSQWTNANAFIGFGAMQLSTAWYGQDFPGNDNDNPRNGIEWWQTGWDGTPVSPANATAVPQAFIHVLRRWGGSMDFSGTEDLPTMHLASMGNIRIEPCYSVTNTIPFGAQYLTLGNEDGNNVNYNNYAHGSVYNHSYPGGYYSSIKPWAKGYSLPLVMWGIGSANSVEYFSTPGLMGYAGDTNATDKSMGEISFFSKMPTPDGHYPTFGVLNPGAIEVFRMGTNSVKFNAIDALSSSGAISNRAHLYMGTPGTPGTRARIIDNSVNVPQADSGNQFVQLYNGSAIADHGLGVGTVSGTTYVYLMSDVNIAMLKAGSGPRTVSVVFDVANNTNTFAGGISAPAFVGPASRVRALTNGVGTVTPNITLTLTNADGAVYEVAARRIVP